MCTVCGCGTANAERQRRENQKASHNAGDRHSHDRSHDNLNCGQTAVGCSTAGISEARLIAVETEILSKNNIYAAENRTRFARLGALALNLVSSPGAGKTTLLCKTIEMIEKKQSIAVIEGDQQTSHDADRIRATGASAVQINTGKGCHLDGHMVAHAMEQLNVAPKSLVFIENVGNLVCPAAFDLGEDAKVVIWSVTEGEDKPLKYPDIFTAAQVALINKIDLAPNCGVDLELCEANLKRVNPNIEVMRVSARTGIGMQNWLAWLDTQSNRKIDSPLLPAPMRSCL